MKIRWQKSVFVRHADDESIVLRHDGQELLAETHHREAVHDKDQQPPAQVDRRVRRRPEDGLAEVTQGEIADELQMVVLAEKVQG